MTLYYQILTTKKIPGEVLTYSYEKPLNLGQFVNVLIRGKLSEGVIFDFINEENLMFDKQKTKSISKVLPAKLNNSQLTFLKLISFNTFNSKNSLFKSFYQPFTFLTKSNWLYLQENFESHSVNFLESENKNDKEEEIKKTLSNSVNKKKSEKQAKSDISVTFELDSNYVVRIINLIRSQKSIQNTSSFINILIIFPEQKLLDKIFYGVTEEFTNQKDINFFKYSNNGNKDAKYTARKVILDAFYNKKESENKNLTSYKQQKINLFFSTRSGVFLPFSHLNEILLIDEPNSMYVQEQNELYFDTRDIVYLMAKSYKCKLVYVSSLPSLRLFQNYDKEDLLKLLKQESYNQKVDFEVVTSQLNPRDKTQIISPFVEKLITGDENDYMQ